MCGIWIALDSGAALARARSRAETSTGATIAPQDASPASLPVPPLIKRNIILFSLCQTFTGAGLQFAYGFGPLMVVQVTGSPALAGLSVALIGFSRFLIAYPIGRITDTWGRRPGIMLGLILAAVGALVTGYSMYVNSAWILVLGLLTFSAGMNAAQQMRVAATDMFLPQRRAEALGYVAMGSLIGLVLSPVIVGLSEHLAKEWGQDPLGIPWLMVPALILPGMVLVTMVRPDPKEIGMNLGHYYPGYVPPPRKPGPEVNFTWADMLSNPRIRFALVVNAAGQGNMTIVMVLTSLVLSAQGYSLTQIAASHMFHTIGMFAFTIPLGRLADRIGNVRLMIPGVLVSLIGAALVAFTTGYWLVTLGTFLVGIGWAAGNVAATAEIADTFESHQRGRAIGVNETIAGGSNVVAALITGPMMVAGGLPATGIGAVLFALPPLLMALIWPRLIRVNGR
jgi:MFS family permease